MIRILSIVTEEYIPEGKKVLWSLEENEVIFIEVSHFVQLNCKTSIIHLEPKDCILSQRLTLNNISAAPILIRTIKLQVEDGNVFCSPPILMSPLLKKTVICAIFCSPYSKISQGYLKSKRN